MRLHILSDLHQEFGEIDVPTVDCNAVILAGDVSTKRNGIRWITRRFPNVPVIYICGNHEYYGEKMPGLHKRLKEEAQSHPNIHFMENESVTIDGVHFFACTLWTNLELQGAWQNAAETARGAMNDYKRVTHSRHGQYRKLKPADTRLAHLESMAAMRSFFEQTDSRSSVIVTHHAPSRRSLSEPQRELLLSAAYASSLDDFILQHQPRLWIHGHIHHSNDYTIGSTRVISNPRAYPDAPNKGFIPDLIIEVPSAAGGDSLP